MYYWQGKVRMFLSPLLYLIYNGIRFSVGGCIINIIRYAGDKAVVANSQKGLQQLMDNLNKVTREFGMKVNVKEKDKGNVHKP